MYIERVPNQNSPPAILLREAYRQTGKAEIGLRVEKVLNRFKVAKHFEVTITDTQFSYQPVQLSAPIRHD